MFLFRLKLSLILLTLASFYHCRNLTIEKLPNANKGVLNLRSTGTWNFESEKERQKSEKLLLNILPEDVAKELKNKAEVDMYYVLGIKDDYSKGSDKKTPNSKFWEIYTKI